VADELVDSLLESVRNYILENGLSEISIPDIEESFQQNVSHAHAQIAEEYVHLLYTIRLIYECTFSVPDPGNRFSWKLRCTRR
jgi:hypothetical protein